MSFGFCFTGEISPLCVYCRSGNVEWASFSRSTGLPPLFGTPINMGCPFLSPAPGVYSWSIWNSCLI